MFFKNKIYTKISIANEVFKTGTLKNCVADYEKYWKKTGWKLDIENEDVFMIYDYEIHLNEGDYYNYVWKVTYKSFNHEENCCHYYYCIEYA